jgi:hypothetical protein
VASRCRRGPPDPQHDALAGLDDSAAEARAELAQPRGVEIGKRGPHGLRKTGQRVRDADAASCFLIR